MTVFSDPLTGRPVRSDRIYKDGSPESNAYGFPRKSNFSFEWEFSKSAMILSNVLREQGQVFYNRIVLLGSFNTKKGLSGRINSFAVGEKVDSYEVNIVKLPSPAAFSGAQQLRSIIEDNPPSEPTSFYSNLGTAASNGLMSVSSFSQLAPTRFLSFYRDNWWENPFNSNLV